MSTALLTMLRFIELSRSCVLSINILVTANGLIITNSVANVLIAVSATPTPLCCYSLIAFVAAMHKS